MLQRTFIPFVIALAAISLLAQIHNGVPESSPLKTAPWTHTFAETPSGSYRFTSNGWEDTLNWRINQEEAKVKFIDRIHPLTWMMLVILVAVGLAILVSDDETVDRLLVRQTRNH